MSRDSWNYIPNPDGTPHWTKSYWAKGGTADIYEGTEGFFLWVASINRELTLEDKILSLDSERRLLTEIGDEPTLGKAKRAVDKYFDLVEPYG